MILRSRKFRLPVRNIEIYISSIVRAGSILPVYTVNLC
jgi:hypothetical protein